MHVVLTHPQHGAKVATNEIEIQQDEKNGWVRYTSATPVEEPEAAPKRKYTRRVVEQSIEQPNEKISASDESEGE
jgi:hypothetical protein